MRTKSVFLCLILACVCTYTQAQKLFGGSFERKPSQALSNEPFSYGLGCTFYADNAGKDALPAQLPFKIIRKRDNAVVREFVANKQDNPTRKVFPNECSAQNARTELELFSVVYFYETIINPTEFNDADGYYVVNEAPSVPRAASSNVKSEKLVLYHWFSPQYLFQSLNNATDGRAATGLSGDFSFQCKNEGKTIRPQLSVSPYIVFFDPDALDLTAIRGKPLTVGALPFQEAEWLGNYSSTNPNGGEYFINDSKPKFDNNSDLTSFEAWSVPAQTGTFVLSFVTQQRRNGVKLAENTLEIFSEVNECIKPQTVAITITEAGNPAVTASAIFCKDKPIQLNATTDDADLDYQWYANGEPIAGAKGKTLKVSQSGSYFLKTKKAGLCGDNTTVTINAIASDCNIKERPEILGLNIHDLVNTVGNLVRPYINQHVFRANYYTYQKYLAKMPKTIQATLFSKRDNHQVDVITFSRNTSADLVHLLDRACDGGKDTIQQVTYDVNYSFTFDKHGDDAGYYLVTDPVCCRADADNLSRKGSSMVGSLDIGPANKVRGATTIQRGHTVDLMVPFSMQTCVNMPARIYLYAGNRENVSAKFDVFAEILEENDINSSSARKMTWASGHSSSNFTGNTKSTWTVEERRNGQLVMLGTPEKPGVFVYRLKIDGIMQGDVYSSVYQEFRLQVNDCSPPPKPTTTISKVGRPTIMASAEQCQDSLVQINLKGARTWSSFQWYKGKTPLFGEDDSVLVVPANQSGLYKCLVKMPRICPDTLSAAVTINYLPKPTATITGQRNSICEGQSVALTAQTNGSRVQWSVDGQATNDVNLNYNVTKTGTYTVKVTDAKGCTNISPPFRVVSGDLPVAEISKPSKDFVCDGQPLTLSVTQSNGNKYVWQADGKTLPQTTPSITVSSAGNYSATITDVYGCVNTSNGFTVRQLENPKATIASLSDAFCENQSISLTAKTDIVGGVKYSWQLDGNTLIGMQTDNILTNRAGEYTVKISDINGCMGTSEPKKIVKNSLPSSTITVPNPFFCGGASTQLSANDGANLSYVWYFNGQPIENQTNKGIEVTKEGEYSLQVTSPQKCVKMSETVRVQQFPKPEATITAPMARFCKGESLVLTASGKNLKSYQWLLENQNMGTTSPNTDFTAIKGGVYTVKVIDNNGCDATSKPFFAEALDPIVVKMDSIPDFCGYAFPPIKLRGNPATGWFSGKGVNANEFTFSPRVAGVGQHTIVYTVKGELSCLSGTDKRSIRIKPAPAINMADEVEIYRGTSTKLNADMGAGYVYTWSPPSWINDVHVPKPVVDPDATTYYTVWALSNANCASEDSIKVKVVQGLHIPGAFSPNGDGMNDRWEIIGLDSYPQAEIYVYDRWGNIVYYGQGPNAKPFDGTGKDGVPLQGGVYIYMIKENAPKYVEHRGSVTILR